MKIRILGVPLDLGQERRGVDMGPSAVRAAGLNAELQNLGHTVEDTGNIQVKIPETQHFGDRRAKYLNEIAETCQEVAHRVYQTLEAKCFPSRWGAITRSPSAPRPASPSSIAIARNPSAASGSTPTPT